MPAWCTVAGEISHRERDHDLNFLLNFRGQVKPYRNSSSARILVFFALVSCNSERWTSPREIQQNSFFSPPLGGCLADIDEVRKDGGRCHAFGTTATLLNSLAQSPFRVGTLQI